ncbi:MAG: PspC domain-containing protein [bacterium]|nr:MAG: PspC domain-containing protein [bacterium]
MLPDLNKIYRSKDNRILFGVCGGIGEYFNIDPVIVRLLWILATFASVGLGILVYVILIFVFPESDTAKQ